MSGPPAFGDVAGNDGERRRMPMSQAGFDGENCPPSPATQSSEALATAGSSPNSPVSPYVHSSLYSMVGPLGDVARALTVGAQVDPAIACQSLMATVSLLAQQHANISTLGGIKPASAYYLTTALSGDSKTTTDGIATRPIVEQQLKDARGYVPHQGVPEPYRLIRDPTVEGLRRAFREGVPSQGLINAEAGTFFGGYGMRPEERLKTCAEFNFIFDGAPISVARGTTGRIELPDRRLTIHLQIQPDAVLPTLHDPMMAGIGFWPRFLLAWPKPSKPRRASSWRPEQDALIQEYWKRCHQLLEPLGPDCSNLRVLEPSPEAQRLFDTYFERLEIKAKDEQDELSAIRAYAVRATEHAYRIAGALAVYSGEQEITANLARCGIAYATQSLETWLRVFGDQEQREHERLATVLYQWLHKRPQRKVTLTDILSIGPKALRSKQRRDAAVAVLDLQGKIVRTDREIRVR